MQQFSPSETALLAAVDASPMLGQVQAWSAVNTGTANLAGLAEQAAMLADAFAALSMEGKPVNLTSFTLVSRGGGNGGLAGLGAAQAVDFAVGYGQLLVEVFNLRSEFGDVGVVLAFLYP